MKTITAKELRLKMKEILQRVEQGEEFTIIYNSRPVAVLTHPDNKDPKYYSSEAEDLFINEPEVAYMSGSRKKEKTGEDLLNFINSDRFQFIPDPDPNKPIKELYHDMLDEKYKKYVD